MHNFYARGVYHREGISPDPEEQVTLFINIIILYILLSQECFTSSSRFLKVGKLKGNPV